MDAGKKDIYKTSRGLYIVEAAVEYLIQILLEGAYIAKLSSAMGISDSLTGIITAIVQLGNTLQIVALFLAGKRPVKRWVTAGHITANLFFTLIYLCPFLKVGFGLRTFIFIALLLIGCFIHNIIQSTKINWYMSLVDNDKRGRFTALKEMISLFAGIVFSYAVGFVMDYFDAKGDINGSFVFCGIAVAVLSVSHALILLFSKEKPSEPIKLHVGENMKRIFSNKNGLVIVAAFLIYDLLRIPATSYAGAYQINELGFSMTFVSIISAVSSVVRAAISLPMGGFGDRHSFKKMVLMCLGIQAAGFLCLFLASPSNGKIMFSAYRILTAVASSGLVGGVINLIYETVGEKLRTEFYALKMAVCGIAGFASTWAFSFLVSSVQAKGNTFLGINICAEQILGLVALIGTVANAIILLFFLKDNGRNTVSE